MILADTNVWLALSVSKHHFHRVASDWFGRQSAARPVVFCRSTQQSFLRLLTTESVLRAYGVPPMTNAQAWAQYEGIASDRRCGFVGEPAGVEARWKRYAERGSASPKVWMDAYLAAFAVCGGFSLATTDKGFRQYDGLDLQLLSKR